MSQIEGVNPHTFSPLYLYQDPEEFKLSTERLLNLKPDFSQDVFGAARVTTNSALKTPRRRFTGGNSRLYLCDPV